MEFDDVHSPTILTPEGWAEIEEEVKNGTPMTPERKAMFELVRERETLWDHDGALADDRAKRNG
jgi:hypothetical protein